MHSDAVVGRRHARPARGAREARVARAVCAGDTLGGGPRPLRALLTHCLVCRAGLGNHV